MIITDPITITISELQTTKTPATVLLRLFRDREIDEKILHYFAVDCAQRSDLENRTRFHKYLIILKRAWLDDKVPSELQMMSLVGLSGPTLDVFSTDAFNASMGALKFYDDRKWQCHRLAWWLRLAQITNRLWLAYDPRCPLDTPVEACFNPPAQNAYAQKAG